MQGNDHTYPEYLQHITPGYRFDPFLVIQHDAQCTHRDQEPEPNQQAFIKSDEFTKNGGEPGKKNSDVQLEQGLFHECKYRTGNSLVGGLLPSMEKILKKPGAPNGKPQTKIIFANL